HLSGSTVDSRTRHHCIFQPPMPGARKTLTTGPARLSCPRPRTITSAWNDPLQLSGAVEYQSLYCVRRALASDRELHYTPGLCGATNLVSAGSLSLSLGHHLARAFHEDSPMAACNEW